MFLLNELAVKGNRTIIATLHQPRSTIFDMIDQLMILDAGKTGNFFFFFNLYYLNIFDLFFQNFKMN